MEKINENNVITSEILKDPRFSKFVDDPRYRNIPLSRRKVKIDSRFKSMFEDKKFQVKFSVDKYGRRVNKTTSDELKQYYDLSSSSGEDETEAEQGVQNVCKSEEYKCITADFTYQKDESVPSEIVKKLNESDVDYSRGEGRLISDSSSDESQTDDEECVIEHTWGEITTKAETTNESTKRLAALHMDWDRIRASDLMVLCSSFLPPGGSIMSVTIYPSNFGKERMKREEIHGPIELVKNVFDSKSLDSDDDLVKEQDSEIEEGDDYHTEKLREYQLNRLKYFYAVIECDSVETADKLYKECNGLEYESTATVLDLRFIPNEMSFDDDEPHDRCTELPDLSKYKPRLFTTTALQQAKVELTWDETNLERKEFGEKLSAGKLSEINDTVIRKYVAYMSEDSLSEKIDESDTETSKKIDTKNGISKYKSILMEIEKKELNEKEDKCEKEYTWKVDVDKTTDDTKQFKNLSVIEKVIEKKREKNKKRKEIKKNKKNKLDADASSSDDLPDGIDLNDPYFAEEFQNNDFEQIKSRRKNKKLNHKNFTVQSNENEKELELLLHDEADDKQHFSLEKIQQNETENTKKKKSKKQVRKRKQDTNIKDDDFEINVNDARFDIVFKSHLYNIDPTDPHFKKTKAMETIINEKFKQRDLYSNNADNEKLKKNFEHKSLVKNLKRKLEKINKQ